MLHNETGKMLFEKYAKNLPIIDYHCHISPKMIAENYQFKNAYELFLGGDHYKWRQMRTNGIDERFITGDADDYEKWEKFAETMPLLIGNPLYHWTHLELKRYFCIDEGLCPETAKDIWDRVNSLLATEEYRVQGLICKSNVEIICTTDAPYDTLEYHKQLKDFGTKVVPAFRPDLSDINCDIPERMDYFHENGCRLSDHAVDDMSDETIEKLIYLGEEYAKRGWVWQLHIGAMRNNNTRMFEKLGADTGFDSVNDFQIAEGLSKILDSLEKKDALPKTVLYTLNPKDNYVLGTMLGNFQGGGIPGKIQFGSGWWFNDQRDGMESQMRALANLGMLSRFVGMLTDSRSFVSYTRHEYFRRILCNLIGKWVEDGEYTSDEKILKKIVEGICYYNAKEYFDF
ncbi:glucuronate isomerase [Oscillospiraceae bacterium DSM 107454]|uniref:Uronate isomerase n=2 Tax=Ructibacterium gallinarum TaxID=2779355 RepID=A0A9D5LYT0_9FIRM|nr:glucuronate isomerase [Ructibacterium gallinarum]